MSGPLRYMVRRKSSTDLHAGSFSPHETLEEAMSAAASAVAANPDDTVEVYRRHAVFYATVRPYFATDPV